jgi:methylated-DNA-protein-cysteine methyltransferase-like protein
MPVTHASGRAHPGRSYEAIYAVVRRIPRGRVATYGQVAELSARPGHARQVGYALHALPADTAVPWHRVVNARGAVSRRSHAGDTVEQRLRLEAEGVAFDANDRIELERYRWKPRGRH